MEVWLGLMVLGAGGLMLAVAGIWMYMSATATPLHPDAETVPSLAQTDPAQRWADAVTRGREIMRTQAAAQNLPGVSVAVGAGGDIVWAEGFGFTDLDNRATVTPQTRFRIGHASTVLTSAAAGLLLEKGRLTLDDEIQIYVPEYPRKKWPVTLRQVMAHTAGIRTDGGDESSLYSQHCDRPVDALPHFAGDLRFEPGTEYRYSNHGWILVSAAIEAAAGEPFLIFMAKQIFEPLQMNDTIPDSTTERIPDLATSYFPRFAADPRYGPDLMRPIDLSCYAGASVFVSTPSDLVRFGMAIDNGTLLQAATVKLLQAPQRLSSGQQTGYGLGWDLETVTLAGQPTGVVGHHGDVLGGPVASLMMIRERGLAVSVISNTSYADTEGMASKIAEVFATPEFR
jgi:CubicO group peptidase (beta-lactamase class C family)